MAEFKDTSFYFLSYWPSFISTFLSLTWSRNMKKDSVSCIICNRQTILLLCVNLFVYKIKIVTSGPLSQEHGASSGYGWRKGLQYGG